MEDDSYETVFHKLLTHTTTTYEYEKQLRYITKYKSSKCINTIEQFLPIITDQSFVAWYQVLLYQNYNENYDKDNLDVPSNNKYKNLMVRKVIRASQTNIQIKRILDHLIYKIIIHKTL